MEFFDAPSAHMMQVLIAYYELYVHVCLIIVANLFISCYNVAIYGSCIMDVQ